MLIYLIPLISAFIGWITNLIAIKMLFHPKKPVRLGFYTLQGIFPKRQEQFAEKLGKLVAVELLSFEDISERLSNPEKINGLLPAIADQMDTFLRRKLPESMPVLSMFIGDNTVDKIKKVFMEEMEVLLPGLIHGYVDSHRKDLDLEKIVTEKVSGFSSDKLEEILNDIMKKEFRFVEIIGGVLGFIIGLLQVLITHWAG
ncbi:MAG TPA: DUF445 family protein [Chitinophagaceae bacterium]|jgi:uncharacterized membrane protein YheB (UPF0754 family)|nr:DUF445 family protein [Chitinophagaceae bacterium]